MISRGRTNTPSDTAKYLADLDKPKWESNPNYRDGDWWLNNLKKTDFSAWIAWWKMYEKGLDLKPNKEFLI